jgi:two-component system cell cycle response regulator DivK
MSRRILLVEDDALSLKLMRDLLQAHGFQTEETGEGAAAVALAIQSPPDLIVMDIGLPGIDGVEATRRLRADTRTSDIPIVAVTAFAMPGDEQRMLEAGCNAFLTKPLRLSDLVATAEGLLEGRITRS